MKLIKTLALAAALAVAGMGTAQAAAEPANYFFLPPAPTSIPGNNDISISFASFIAHDPAPAARLAGDTFDDFFIFNVPDSRDISFFAANTSFGLLFSSFNVAPAYGLGTSANFTTGASVGHFVNGGGVTLDSGSYQLELTGTYLKTGATYFGQIDAAALPVPEPESWALMLTGGMVALLARRRKNRA